jgi:hypothetical protein
MKQKLSEDINNLSGDKIAVCAVEWNPEHCLVDRNKCADLMHFIPSLSLKCAPCIRFSLFTLQAFVHFSVCGLQGVVEIIKNSVDVSKEDDVVEVDIDKLSNNTLAALRKYVDDILRPKAKAAPAPKPAAPKRKPKALQLSDSSSESGSRYVRSAAARTSVFFPSSPRLFATVNELHLDLRGLDAI